MTHPPALAILRLVPLVLLLAPAADAETWKVPKDFETIAEALAASTAGDVIKVSKGSYDEVVILDGVAGLELKGSGTVTVLGLQIQDCTDLIVSGLTVTASGAASISTSTDCLLEKCHVSGSGLSATGCTRLTLSRCTATDVGDSGFVIFDGTDIVIEDCEVEGSANSGIRLGSGGAVTGARLEDNRVRDAESGLWVDEGSELIIEGNDVRDCDLGLRLGSGGVSSSSVTGNKLRDCTDLMFLVNVQDVVVLDNDVDDVLNGLNINTGCQRVHVLENDFRGVGSAAVTIATGVTGVIVQGNAFRRLEQEAVNDFGTGTCVLDNLIKDAGAGVVANGPATRIAGNSFSAITLIAIRVIGNGAIVGGNVVSKAGTDGIIVDGDNGVIAGNGISKAGLRGIWVNGTGNLLTGNTTKKSVEVGLLDDTAPGDNTFVANQFDSISPRP